jgi:hypothetical protein
MFWIGSRKLCAPRGGQVRVRRTKLTAARRKGVRTIFNIPDPPPRKSIPNSLFRASPWRCVEPQGTSANPDRCVQCDRCLPRRTGSAVLTRWNSPAGAFSILSHSLLSVIILREVSVSVNHRASPSLFNKIVTADEPITLRVTSFFGRIGDEVYVREFDAATAQHSGRTAKRLVRRIESAAGAFRVTLDRENAAPWFYFEPKLWGRSL